MDQNNHALTMWELWKAGRLPEHVKVIEIPFDRTDCDYRIVDARDVPPITRDETITVRLQQYRNAAGHRLLLGWNGNPPTLIVGGGKHRKRDSLASDLPILGLLVKRGVITYYDLMQQEPISSLYAAYEAASTAVPYDASVCNQAYAAWMSAMKEAGVA